ncbi:MAG TPA: glycosyltransferase [Puia sp.]|uniref:glycosyltransferase n=1 Tax=Puia sp. TaxID=2045100 RepID=UPI002BEFB4D5|nr:glycosyltransferase [Puia sp.]HVU95075.1 glycosyltransferase [Puia sp.]
MDIVIVGLQPWYVEIGSNCKSIALEFAKEHRVLYINMPIDRKTAAGRSPDPKILHHLDLIRNRRERIIPIAPNLWNYYPKHILESANWLPSTKLFKLACLINGHRFAADIRAATHTLGFKDYILFNDNDIFRSFYLKDLLHPKLYIYYSRDNLLGVPYWKKHGSTLEPLHIAKADIGVANSVYLANMLRKYNPNSHYIGQGCNLKLFDPDKNYPRPDDIKDISGPIIGYVGAIVDLRIDGNIIGHIARTRPDWNIIMVGPEDTTFAEGPLHHLPNVRFLGKKDIPALPAYISHFDVCINPQRINEVTIGNYPLKVDEYLAMGKPVVATRTETMSTFGDTVYLADTAEDYPPLIETALSGNAPDRRSQRIRLANTHTWEASVRNIYAAIENKRPI